VEFIESRAFTRRLHALAGDAADELLQAIQGNLEERSDRGALVPGLGGVRKARMGNPKRGKGKSGGFRYLYLHLGQRLHIHLLMLLDKNEQEDATEEQRRQIAGLGRANQERCWRVKMAKKTKVNIFEDMKGALRDVAAYERGEGVNLRVTRIPPRPKRISPKEVRQIRETLKASQALFASYLNVSANAVRSWEQGTRRPRQAALKLLMIAKKNPKALLVA
jgi:putative transcriptional regulator